MTSFEDDSGSSYIAVGGDFANVLDHNDYLALINSTDTAGVVLRAHLILEDFLNIWCSKTSGSEDLFKGPFIGFRSKLSVAQNLGLDSKIFEVLDRFNKIRNSYSHNRRYTLEQSRLDALILLVDDLHISDKLLPCKDFSIYIEGTETASGRNIERNYKYENADLNKKIIIVFMVLVLNLLSWMQSEFERKGINYTIISDFLGK